MSAPDALREAFRQRALGAVERMAREASSEDLVSAMAASTDVGTLAIAAAHQATAEAVRRLDPLAAAIARGGEARIRLSKQAGGLLCSGQAASFLQVTRPAVDKRRSVGKALAVRVRGNWLYPACQFRDGEVLPGISEVLASMTDASGWAVLSFLLAEEEALGGRTPLAALAAGDVDPVVRLVRAQTSDAYA
jgi:hypothetical protein